MIRRVAHVVFTQQLKRFTEVPEVDTPAATLREALQAAFERNPRLRGYVLDDQGALRRHMNIVVCGRPIKDRIHLSDPVPEDGEIYVIQALSGG